MGAPGTTVDIEALSIGDELLDGSVEEANALFLARALADHGLALRRHCLVRDLRSDIVAALRDVAAHAEECVVSGGLGPTDDDRTAGAAAEAAGVGMVRHGSWIERLELLFERFGRPMGDNNARQADLPEGAELVVNERGTAPAFCLEIDGCRFHFLPGVPSEYQPLCLEVVVPRIVEATDVPPITSLTLKTFGLPESEVDRRLADLADDPHVAIGYRASFPEVHVKLRATGQDSAARLSAMADAVEERLGGRVFTRGDDSFPATVVRALGDASATVAVAESCTGGLVGKLLTDVPGASAVFVGGALVYSNALKEHFADVPAALIEAHGAVSEPVARALAQGIRARTGATFGLGITGVAGPGGGSPDKPVGLVHGSVAGPAGTTHRSFRFPGDRARIRGVAAYGGLSMLLRAAREAS